MRVPLIKRRVVLYFFILIMVAITISLALIYLLDKRINPQINIKNFSARVLTISKHPRASEDIKKSLNKSLSGKERYDALVTLSNDLQIEYASTNNPALFTLINNDLRNFAKDNFSKYYKEKDFKTPCTDSICADEQQPAEILSIIKDIQNSDFEPDVKKTLIQDILNTGYRSKKQSFAKMVEYDIMEQVIRNNDQFSKTGQNKTIADKIDNFVKNRYKKELEEAKNATSPR